ncbi:MAG: PA0069 family radical SAM protein [Phycisphaerae bacterium]|nr:PA0069 family radical SAM protein [Phycisphaerae bacterium]
MPPNVRGRGAGVNPASRFDDFHLHVLGEHLDELVHEHPGGVQVITRVDPDHARSILNPVESPDVPGDWTLNPYRGCEHGCIYCYARPGHEYLGLSCGLDFETRIFAKHDAPQLLRRALREPSWTGRPITMSGVTDPYQPIERRLCITRRCLEVCVEARQAVSVITKNHLVTRDRDLLSALAKLGAAHAAVSITTLDHTLAASMEPRASAPADRLRAIRELADVGVPVTVMTAPIIPGLNDHEVPAILAAARDAGAVGAGYVMLRLPHQIKDVFFDWLRRHHPARAGKVESLIRDVRAGALNDPRFKSRMRGEGPLADQLAATFKLFKRRLGLNDRASLDTSHFRRPAAGAGEQMDLF